MRGQPHGDALTFEGIDEPPLAAACNAEKGMGKAQIGRELGRLQAFGFGFRVTSEIDQHAGQIAPGQNEPGRDADALAQFRHGLIELPQRLQRIREVVAGVGQARIDRHRAAKVFGSLLGATLVAQRVAQVEPYQRVSRKPPSEPAQQRFGLAELALHGECRGHAQLWLEIARIEAACIAERAIRVRVAPEREIRLGQTAGYRRMVAQCARGMLQVVHCACGIAGLKQRDAQQVQRVRMVGCNRKRPLKRRNGGRKIALVLRAHPGTEMGLQLLLTEHAGHYI